MKKATRLGCVSYSWKLFSLMHMVFQASFSAEDLLMKAREFRTKGTFDWEIGDVVLRACCNILQIPILVITSNHTIPFLSFKCDHSIINEPFFIAFHYYGAGHYDATDSIASGRRLHRGNNYLYYRVVKT